MSPSWGSRAEQLQRVLEMDLAHAIFLTPAEAAGGWSELFPELAHALPAPYPIFATDEETILARGYPVLLAPAMQQLRVELDRHVQLETEYRVAAARGENPDKAKLMAQRERYQRAVSSMLENAMVNDYGRGLVEVLVLLHLGDVAQAVGKVGALAVRCDRQVAQQQGDALRFLVGRVFADLLLRAAQQAADALRRITQSASLAEVSPLLTTACHDLLPLCEHRIAPDLGQLAGLIRVQLRLDAADLVAVRDGALRRLAELAATRPELLAAIRIVLGDEGDPLHPSSLLQPAMWRALRGLDLLQPLGLGERHESTFVELGRVLKRFELISALTRRIVGIESHGPTLVLAGRRPPVAIAASTRPFDFTRTGVVDSSVHRFGLVYDLSSFTALLEEVRKEGQRAEERALQFMYVFQRRLDDLRSRHRLTFEKFLGDGAFYSSRRAATVLAAACEIQRLYDQLRCQGFPFNRGIRIAMNYGTYRLLPLVTRDAAGPRFEFFGHGVVELARLTTGKSTRELEEISEFLVNWGYEPGRVDTFLRPLAAARRGAEEGPQRPYAAWLDQHGELVNEGIVLTVPFLETVERELGDARPWLCEAHGLRWVVYPLPGEERPLFVGVRMLGVARLKGLQPLEVIEATVWPDAPEGDRAPLDDSLLTVLRRITSGGTHPVAARPDTDAVPPDLAVITYLEDGGGRAWIFGRYNRDDDLLHQALTIPLRPPDLQRGEPLELWLFRNRQELARLYASLRRDSNGEAIALQTLRRRDGYLGCFLAAPHRAPG